MKPMLAKKYADHKAKLRWPVALQPKLDGIRCMYHNSVLQSRSARTPEIKTWPMNRLLHLRTALSWCPPWLLLDGELYVHGLSRQEINGLAAVNGIADKAKTPQLQYWIFDCVDSRDTELTFSQRHGILADLFDHASPSLHLVTTQWCLSPSDADILYAQYKQSNFEGAMYRVDAPYGFVEHCGNQENRWTIILKRKDALDGEYHCVGVTLGEGKYDSMVGALILDLGDGRTFNAGSGLSDEQRVRYVENSPAGLMVTVEYDILSNAGVPIQPRIKEVYE